MLIKLLREGLGRVVIFIDFLTRPRAIQRSAAEQAKVDEQTCNLALYQFYACPFCIKTRRAIRRLGLNIETRDAQRGSPHRDTLAAGGGEIKVPCLRIAHPDRNQGADGDTWMYESSDIIAWLESRFGEDAGKEDTNKPATATGK